ncbi:MAG: acetate--CoA ligase family protein, partial [Nitrospiraceae bacterium]|nr:acetate--CoA ligase family protein [Nitrospiraceae bacterium]
MLKDLGLQVPKGVFIPAGKRISRPRGLRFPLAVKAASPDIRSKSEARALRLGIRTEREFLHAAGELLKNVKGARGLLVEEMHEGGIEAIAGGFSDAQFGPVTMFGLGGFFVEVFRDVSFALAPTSRAEALKLASRIKGFNVLKGVRGRPAVDFDAMSRAIETVSRLIATGLIKEIDLNPVSLSPEGAVVLDAKIFV